MLLKRKVIVILGPTASGKSALGVRLAKKYHGVVISADSRQVYRNLDVGTAKISKKEMQGVPHYLLDVASPKAQYSVARYAKDVQRVLKKIPSRSPVFLVGGTPFYIKAITEPGSFSPVPPNPALRRRLADKTTAQLIALLRKKNPVRLKNIDAANRRRLVRAIEIALYRPPPAGGGAARSAGVVGTAPLHALKIGLQVNRDTLYTRIDRRVDMRMQRLVREVKQLHMQGLSWKRLESFGLEYRFTSLFLQSKITQADAAQKIKFGSHDFVRRQLTWWRKEKDIHWITTTASAPALVTRFLKS